MLASPHLSPHQKAGALHLLWWRELNPWVTLQIYPIVAAWLWVRGPDRLDWLTPIFVVTTLVALSSGPAQAIVAYLRAAPAQRLSAGWFVCYTILSVVLYTELKNLIARVALLQEGMRERQWKVTPRGVIEGVEEFLGTVWHQSSPPHPVPCGHAFGILWPIGNITAPVSQSEERSARLERETQRASALVTADRGDVGCRSVPPRPVPYGHAFGIPFGNAFGIPRLAAASACGRGGAGAGLASLTPRRGSWRDIPTDNQLFTSDDSFPT
jgi:hypothetical protein